MPTAAILTTQADEYQAVRAHLSDIREIVHPEGTLYEVGTFEAWHVAIAEVGQGSRIASIEMSRAVDFFSPTVVLFVGVAFALRKVSSGDVVAVSGVYIKERNGPNNWHYVEYPVTHSLVQRARAVIRQSTWVGRYKGRHVSGSSIDIPQSRDTEQDQARAPRVVLATAVWRRELPEEHDLKTLRKRLSKTVIVDLDAAGPLEDLHKRDDVSPDIGIIRGVIDPSHEPNGKDRVNALQNAAAFTFELLSKLPTQTLGPRKSKPRKLYLKQLTVHEARCFNDLDVSFVSKENKPRMLTQLVGRNGSGKTSLLRILALALCQQKEASALMSQLAGEFIRQGASQEDASEAVIELSLFDAADPDTTYLTRTIVRREPSGQEIVLKETEPEDFPWGEIFVSGYGVNRGTGPGEPLPSDYRRMEAVASLFDDRSNIIDAESVLRALKLGTYEADEENGSLFHEVVMHLQCVLNLEPHHGIDVTSKHVQVHGPWGSMPLHALGDGYRGTVAWLLDLLGRAYLAGSISNGGSPAGIVLIDEMDEHLHPSWQKTLLKMLRQRFPEVQFVSTTHSPMSIVNCSQDELFACDVNDGLAQIHQLSGPEGRTADRILRGEWFGLASTLDDESEALLHRYEGAVRNKVAQEEIDQARSDLQDRIGLLFDSPIDELAIEIAAEYRRQRRADISPAERKRLVQDAARELYQRLEEYEDSGE